MHQTRKEAKKKKKSLIRPSHPTGSCAGFAETRRWTDQDNSIIAVKRRARRRKTEKESESTPARRDRVKECVAGCPSRKTVEGQEKKTRSFWQKHGHVTARKAETRDWR